MEKNLIFGETYTGEGSRSHQHRIAALLREVIVDVVK